MWPPRMSSTLGALSVADRLSWVWTSSSEPTTKKGWLSFYLIEWDGALFERYDGLLRKVYRANRHVIDSMLREEATERDAALKPLLKAA